MWCLSNTASTHADFQFRREGQRSIKELVSSWASIENPCKVLTARAVVYNNMLTVMPQFRNRAVNLKVFVARLLSTGGHLSEGCWR